ncbi:DUF5655 domain-containing protein [Thalassiella azotivora]
MGDPPRTAEELLAPSPLGLEVLGAVRAALAGRTSCEERVGRSQVAFYRERGFAYLWRPGQYLRSPSAELVLSLALPEEVDSPRFKQVVRPSPRHWMHHLELRHVDDVDAEVRGWLVRAWESAVRTRP